MKSLKAHPAFIELSILTIWLYGDMCINCGLKALKISNFKYISSMKLVNYCILPGINIYIEHDHCDYWKDFHNPLRNMWREWRGPELSRYSQTSDPSLHNSLQCCFCSVLMPWKNCLCIWLSRILSISGISMSVCDVLSRRRCHSESRAGNPWPDKAVAVHLLYIDNV